MFCVKCQKNIIDCICPDIEERLKSLLDGPVGASAAHNLMARKLKREMEAAMDSADSAESVAMAKMTNSVGTGEKD
jgi:hypothetical protein